MSGYGHSSGIVTQTGDSSIDGVLGLTKWEGSITYSFPTASYEYSNNGYYDKFLIVKEH